MLLTLAACGQSREYIDPNFSKYVQKFSSTYNVDVNLDMRFAPQTDMVVGVCISYSNGDRKIEIDKEAWDAYDDESREMLIFHELGHCVLDRPHREELITSGYRQIPASIMYPSMFSSQTYESYKEDYLYELSNPNYTFRP